MEKFKKEVAKKKTAKQEDLTRQVATRSLIERDFKEEILKVSFNTSKDTRRSVLARKPNQEEFVKILRLSLEANMLETKNDLESSKRLIQIYGELPKIAGNLCTDTKLNETFWAKAPFDALQNFISELIVAFQTGGMIEEDEMNTFR